MWSRCGQVSPSYDYCGPTQVSPAYDNYGGYNCKNGSTFVLIVVLFILLIIVGASFM